MPQVRKLSSGEVQALRDKGKGVRRLAEERYDQALADFNVGDYGELVPDPGENRLTARNRLKAAANRRGVSLSFMRVRGDAVRFKVADGEQQSKPMRRMRDFQDQPTPVVPSLNAPPPKNTGGRRKKQPA